MAAMLAACGPDSWTVDASTEPETVEVAPGETLERQVVYEGIGGWITVIARVEEVSTPSARLRIRHVDGQDPSCTAEGEFDAPAAGGVIELPKVCRDVFEPSDRTIFIDNIGTERVRFVYRTRGEIHVERKSSSGREELKLTEIRRGLPATPTP
jgi:hypothetical protein